MGLSARERCFARMSRGGRCWLASSGVGLVRPGVPSPEPTVSQFLLAWESRQYLQAAELTTGSPHAVAAELASAYERLDASDLNLSMRGVSQQGKTASASFDASIDLGGSGLTWSYANSFALRDGSSGWRVVWSPSVIVPGMTDREQLAVVSSWDQRSQLLDSAGQPLTVPSTVYQVGVIPGRADATRTPTADGLATVTELSAEQIEGQMDQGLSGRVPAAAHPVAGRVRRAAATGWRRSRACRSGSSTERLFDSIAPDVVGSVGTETAERAADRRRASTGRAPLSACPGSQQTFQRQLTGTPRTEVVLQQSGQPAVDLKTWPGIGRQAGATPR